MASNIKEQSTNQENLKILAEYCNVNPILKRIGMRWKMQLLYCIHEKVYQFSKLKNIFPSISDQILAKRIAELLEEGLICKSVIPSTVPQQVRYSVTNKGKELIKIILALNRWGEKWDE
ncbi:winged helix-turn-helix transcriptional regulator [Fulvivirga sediminis]|uniref:Helix-turn-helix transcriptional regulator n=1 Tax=Fulvivirga sediminis TaxID=2803949 RepID=A0A937F9N8_9BACT|nr:helix-turn-helix domain-containing protein [Fulvivirga sediminis]MBL3659057.1 helix-turn-helix transcriptional regulator [Fulvivirga sediminis]